MLDEQIRSYGRAKEAAEEAIRICQDRGVLLRYLREQEKEVVNNMVMLLDEQFAVEQYGRAQREEGVISTLIGLVKDNLLFIREAAIRADMSEESFSTLLAKS